MSYNKMEDTIQEAYKNVNLFNKIAGNLDNVTPESIDSQLSFVYEELCETIDAVEYGNDLEALDGVCDLFVTVAGLMQKLEAAGFDVSGALKMVNENNLQKYVPYDVRKDSMEFAPANTFPIIDDVHNVIIFKDKGTGKIRKPTNFVPVNLKGFEVVGFLAGAKGGV
jgi:hypothetical protein